MNKADELLSTNHMLSLHNMKCGWKDLPPFAWGLVKYKNWNLHKLWKKSAALKSLTISCILPIISWLSPLAFIQAFKGCTLFSKARPLSHFFFFFYLSATLSLVTIRISTWIFHWLAVWWQTGDIVTTLYFPQ